MRTLSAILSGNRTNSLTILGGENEAITLLSLPAFLDTDMYKKVILQIVLPPLGEDSYIVRTFKVSFYVKILDDVSKRAFIERHCQFNKIFALPNPCLTNLVNGIAMA